MALSFKASKRQQLDAYIRTIVTTDLFPLNLQHLSCALLTGILLSPTCSLARGTVLSGYRLASAVDTNHLSRDPAAVVTE